MADNPDSYQTRQAAEGKPETTRGGPVYSPLTDIYETPDGLEISLELPGASPESVEATVDKRVLTVRANAGSSVPEGYAAQRVEFREGEYERAFTLSEALDAGRIEAHFKDGVLTLKLPKAEAAGARRIAVETG